MMTTDLETTIDRIFDHLQQLGSPVANRRRAGVCPANVESKIRALGLQPPEDLVRLYAACDGTATAEGERLGTIQFFPGFYWMSLDEASTVYQSIRKDDRWGRAWFPIFGNGGGDFYAVICDQDSPFFGEIVGFVLGEHDQIVEFKSVSSMFETIERSFAQKAFFSSNEHFTADYPAVRAIARTVQPGFVEHDI